METAANREGERTQEPFTKTPAATQATSTPRASLLMLPSLRGMCVDLPPLEGPWEGDNNDTTQSSSQLPRIDPICVPLDALQVIQNLVRSGWSSQRQQAMSASNVVVSSRRPLANGSAAVHEDRAAPRGEVPSAPPSDRRPPGLGPSVPVATSVDKTPVVDRSDGTTALGDTPGAALPRVPREPVNADVKLTADGLTKRPSLLGRIMCMPSGTSLRVYPAFLSAIDTMRLLASSVSTTSKSKARTMFAFDTLSPDGVVLAAQSKPRGGGHGRTAPVGKPLDANVVADGDDSIKANTTSAVDFAPSAAAAPTSPPQWDCPACTYVNLGEHDQCEMCETRRTAASNANASSTVDSTIVGMSSDGARSGDDYDGGGGMAASAVASSVTTASRVPGIAEVAAGEHHAQTRAAPVVSADPPARRLFVVDLAADDADSRGAAAGGIVSRESIEPSAEEDSSVRSLSGTSRDQESEPECEPSRTTSGGRRKRGVSS